MVRRCAFVLILAGLALAGNVAFAQTCYDNDTCWQYRILLVGDSWAQGMFNDLSFNQCLADYGAPKAKIKGDLTAVGGTTADSWAQTANLDIIRNELIANPSIDYVHIQLGGNDFLNGWNASMSSAQEDALFLAVKADLQTIVDAILAVDPGYKIVLGSYDFLNFDEKRSGNFGCILQYSNMGSPTPTRMNNALARMDSLAKRDLAAMYPNNLKFANCYGTQHYAFGYEVKGFGPGVTPYPGNEASGYSPCPGGYPQYWSEPAQCADCIHYNTDGYYFVEEVAVSEYFAPWIIAEGQPYSPGQAGNPAPAHNATNVSTTPTLSWSAASGANSYRVYFGTDIIPDDGRVDDGTGVDLVGNTTGLTWNPGTLAANTKYFWRINPVNAQCVTKGIRWIFTTGSGATPQPATNPSPANGATNVSTTADLSWTAGSGATSHDVYFGTSNPPAFRQNQTGTTFDTGTMTAGATYYWRIDEVNANGTTTGTVWSFTTQSGTATSMHVDSIVCSTVAGTSGRSYGKATVVIKNNLGQVVPNANVTGQFTGSFSETMTRTTDANGQAVFQTTGQVKRPSFQFCVTNAVHATLTYNSGGNVETCDSY